MDGYFFDSMDLHFHRGVGAPELLQLRGEVDTLSHTVRLKAVAHEDTVDGRRGGLEVPCMAAEV